jgi:hypothetical protein
MTDDDTDPPAADTPAPFDQLSPELQDAFLEAIAVTLLEAALDAVEADAAKAPAPDQKKKAG